jgi:DNA-binding beta-propeller fold protein YncE/predicted small lipoprotein YifL
MRVVVLLAVLTLMAGCGSAAPDELPAAAEPASSPPASEPPAGTVVTVGHEPEGVVADPATGLVAVGLRRPARLALIDGARGKVVRRLALPAAARHLAVASGTVLAPAEGAGELVRVALASGRSSSTAAGRGPHAVAVASGSVYVGDELDGTVTQYRGERRVRRLHVGLQPGGITALDRGRQIAVVSTRERVVETYDVASGRRTGRAAAGVGPTHAVSDGGKYLFVTDTAGGAVLIYHLRPSLALIRRYAVPDSPYGIAIDDRRCRLYVTLTGRNELWQFNVGARLTRLARFATPRQPNTVAVDEATGRVYVTGKADDALQLLDPERDRTA